MLGRRGRRLGCAFSCSWLVAAADLPVSAKASGPALRHDAAVDPRYTIGFPPGASMSIAVRQLNKRLGGREILRGIDPVVRQFIDGRADGPLPVW
jgi:hypothetical protein